jgi:hypothetical protein
VKLSIREPLTRFIQRADGIDSSLDSILGSFDGTLWQARELQEPIRFSESAN